MGFGGLRFLGCCVLSVRRVELGATRGFGGVCLLDMCPTARGLLERLRWLPPHRLVRAQLSSKRAHGAASIINFGGFCLVGIRSVRGGKAVTHSANGARGCCMPGARPRTSATSVSSTEHRLRRPSPPRRPSSYIVAFILYSMLCCTRVSGPETASRCEVQLSTPRGAVHGPPSSSDPQIQVPLPPASHETPRPSFNALTSCPPQARPRPPMLLAASSPHQSDLRRLLFIEGTKAKHIPPFGRRRGGRRRGGLWAVQRL
ncbi:hypothetical protein M885DRAFT_244851 [Pelagophyceae sp. CCMP2097]|nr:hypothetical protein M885DRAFT_244851 [Pelagophyceae sp. CCMP2097]